MEGIQEQLDQWKRDKVEKKTMTISTIKDYVDYKGFKYALNIIPKGKGFYDVEFLVGLTDFDRSKVTITDYFCHSISMSRVKDFVLICYKHLNNQ